MKFWSQLYSKFSRRKTFDDMEASQLSRVLGVLDLTALGVGGTLGVGVYVLAGEVARDYAGPAAMLSFLIAAIASVFAGLCYAEFGARVPRAGSAYIYSYVSVGEFIGFVIGWNLIMEYSIGAASVVRGLSSYTDSLANNAISNWFLDTMPMNVSFLAPYPDLFSLAVVMIFTLGLMFGMRESTLVNNVFTALNLSVVAYVIICGIINADIANWQIAEEDIPADKPGGTGGFFPYGITGVVKGASVCFYGFVGFDCIATAGEEAKNPQRSIPLAIVLALGIIFCAYFGISSVLTLMWPYYDQDINAPLPFVFAQIGWETAKWIVTIGAIFGLLASLFGSLYPLPRIIYAMSSDGILFTFLGRIHPRFKTPIWSTLVGGSVAGIMATFFDLSQLVKMLSIGTLMAYTIVAVCVTLLRFKEVQEGFQETVNASSDGKSSFKDVMGQFVNARRLKVTTQLTERLVMWLLILYCIVAIGELAIVIWWGDGIMDADAAAVTCLSIGALLMIAILVCISLQPRSTAELSFTVPLVPFIPGLSILINFYLMMNLDVATWWRFLIWMAVGFAIYFGYGIRKSREAPKYKARRALQSPPNHEFLETKSRVSSLKEQ